MSVPRLWSMPWHPYRLDVAELVKPGKNTIEVMVVDTLINVLEAVQKKSGIFNEPKLIHAHTYLLSS